MSDFEIEESLLKRNFRFICGVDEVGRGALFGPVVSGAVILHPQKLHPHIDDSKRLSPAMRWEMARFIYRHAQAYAIGWCWNDEIDRLNILEATKRSMADAVRYLQIRPDFALVDGLDPGFLGIPGLKLIHGDSRSMSIAAASIIAKTFRDQLLDSFAGHFPQYRLASNKGYPTRLHRNVISLLGRTWFHRLSFKTAHGQ